MFDGNSEQNFSPGAGSDYGPGLGDGYSQGMGGIGKFIPIIAVVIVIAIVAFAVLSYLSSQHDVVINLKDSDGKFVEGKITLRDGAQKIIPTDPKDTSDSFNAKLFNGDYRVSASATGYKPTTKTITVTNEETDFDINMSRDLTATLNAELAVTDLFEGQSISGKLSVSNNGNEFNTSDIISASTVPLDVKITYPQTSTITTGGSVYLDFTVSIKTATALKEIKNAKLVFKIKGSDIVSNSIDVKAMPSVLARDVTLTANITSTALSAGTEKEFSITIKNGNKTIPLKDVKVEVVPDADYTSRINWFRFSNPNTAEEFSTTIENIDPTKQEIIKLYVTPPITAKKDDDFKGTLKLTSFSLNGEKSIIINLKVSTEKNASLQFLIKGADPAPLTINCSATSGICETLSFSTTKDASLKNNGNIDISQIKIEVNLMQSDADCLAYLTTFKTTNTNPLMVPLLEASKDTPIIMDITAPADAPNADVTRCVIQWTYIDPLSNPAQTITDSKILEINKTIR